MAEGRLTKEDWITAGFEALASLGFGALKAEALARDLKTTKGSFYWHFKDLKAYKASLLERWQSVRADDIIDQLSELEPGLDRIHALLGMARKVGASDTSIQAEHAIREWARYDRDAAQRVEAVDTIRLGYLTEQFEAMGLEGEHYARALYASYLGARMLSSSVGTEAAQDLQFILDCLIREAEIKLSADGKA